MSRSQGILPLVLVLALVACESDAPEVAVADAPVAAEPSAPDLSTVEGRIASAMSAAPAAIAGDAAIMEMGADGGMTELRAGTNGWLCMPDNPNTPGPDPMCADGVWQAWFGAYMSRAVPAGGQVGTAYMLAGGADASNTDPFATEPAAGEDWVMSGPHIMTLPADAAQLDGLPTDPNSGGPYVMWAGTPYAHLMVPVTRD